MHLFLACEVRLTRLQNVFFGIYSFANSNYFFSSFLLASLIRRSVGLWHVFLIIVQFAWAQTWKLKFVIFRIPEAEEIFREIIFKESTMKLRNNFNFVKDILGLVFFSEGGLWWTIISSKRKKCKVRKITSDHIFISGTFHVFLVAMLEREKKTPGFTNYTFSFRKIWVSGSSRNMRDTMTSKITLCRKAEAMFVIWIQEK